MNSYCMHAFTYSTPTFWGQITHWSLHFFHVFLRPKYCTHLLDPHFLTSGEFQEWDWLWYPLTCGPKGGVGVRMEQKSLSKLLSWSGFEPRNSRLAVQQATGGPPRPPPCIK